MSHDERTHHLRLTGRIRKIRPCVVIAAGALQLFLIIESRADKSDLYHCLATRTLEQEPRTEMLPKGSCPIRLGQSCYDRSYGLEVSNKCPVSIRIHVDGGDLGKPGSVTGITPLILEASASFAVWRQRQGARESPLKSSKLELLQVAKTNHQLLKSQIQVTP